MSEDMREYAKELLDGNRYWCSQNGLPFLAAVMKRLLSEVDQLPDEAFADLDGAFTVSGSLEKQLHCLHYGAIDGNTSATDYVDALGAIHSRQHIILH